MRTSRKPRVILIFLIALCGLFVYSYTSRLVEKTQVEAKIALMHARIDEAKAEQEKLLNELENLNQPDFIDQVARKDFDMARPGDRLLVMIKEPVASSFAENITVSASGSSVVDLDDLPVWRQWVVFFTSEAFTLSNPG